MATVTVVEPNNLLRLGILNLLQGMKCNITSEGIDYAQLFAAKNNTQSPDLMLLSVPDVYDHMVELVNAAQQGYAPDRILLLSDTHTLPYSLLNLPPVLAGYVSKYSPRDVLVTSVMLVLAGGKCFPQPDVRQTGKSPADGSTGAPYRRRWYDKISLPAKPDAVPGDPINLLSDAESRNLHRRGAEASAPRAPQAHRQMEALSPEQATKEAALLNLTPRQYEVLVLLARGHTLKKVSQKLDISVATTKTHTEALYQRLSVNNRNAAVYAAIAKGATLGWRDSQDAAAGPSAAPRPPT